MATAVTGWKCPNGHDNKESELRCWYCRIPKSVNAETVITAAGSSHTDRPITATEITERIATEATKETCRRMSDLTKKLFEGEVFLAVESRPSDPINGPEHYDGSACIEAIEKMIADWPAIEGSYGFSIVKYLWRHRRKGRVESLKKARWFLDRLIARAEAAEKKPEHRCGVQGFDGMKGDVCPACTK